MTEFRYPVDIEVSNVGHIALDLIAIAGWTRTAAVFDNSFYIETNGPWVCVTGPTQAMGPLALRCHPTRQVNWRACGMRRGMIAYAGGTTLYVPPLFRFSFAGASTWAPPAVPRWTPESVRRGLKHLFERMRTHGEPCEGLGCMILPDSTNTPWSALAKQAFEPVTQLRRWLDLTLADRDGATQVPAIAVAGLAGLGPGLTPSGDDFLGGMIIGLCLVEYRSAAAQLFDAIPAACMNRISVSHLQAAAAGSCSAGVHTAVNAILRGDTQSLSPKLDAVGRIGHTSGWDTLAGAVTVLTTRLRDGDTAIAADSYQPIQ